MSEKSLDVGDWVEVISEAGGMKARCGEQGWIAKVKGEGDLFQAIIFPSMKLTGWVYPRRFRLISKRKTGAV